MPYTDISLGAGYEEFEDDVEHGRLHVPDPDYIRPFWHIALELQRIADALERAYPCADVGGKLLESEVK